MTSEWEIYTLHELCTLTKGASPTMKTPPGKYPLIVTGRQPLTSNEFQFEGEAVCIPMVSSTGHGHASLKRVHYASGQFAVANIVTAAKVKDSTRCSTRFLHIYLQHFKDDLIVPRMKGTANVSLSQKALATVPVALPALDEQRRIVDLVGAIDAVIDAAETSAIEAEAALSNFRESLFQPPIATAGVQLDELLTRVRLPVAVAPADIYTEIGIRSHGRGVFIKEPVTGEQIGGKKVFRMTPGCLAFSVVFSWEGATALLGQESEGKIASHRFPTFAGRVPLAAEILSHFFKTSPGRQLLVDCSPGGAGRNKTLNQNALLSSTVSLSVTGDWQGHWDRIVTMEDAVEQANGYVESLRTLRSNIVAALLSEAHTIPDSYDAFLEAVNA